MMRLPRVLIAAPGSNHGKTTVAAAVMAALTAAGRTVSPHKVGPDYVDPILHGLACGRPGRNLDPALVGDDRVVPMLVHGAAVPVAADLAVIEGVMGLFDGANGGATAQVATLTDTPVVLVIDASGMAGSIAALARGFAEFDPAVRVAGVIANKVGSPSHVGLLRDALTAVGIPLIGALPRQAALTVPERTGGLATDRAPAGLDAWAAAAAEHIDLAELERIAAGAPDLPVEPAAPLTSSPADRPVRIALLAGPAFTPPYFEQLEQLCAAGAEVIAVDPLADADLPADTAGLIACCGPIAAYALELAANEPMRSAIAELAASGAPIIAECSGAVYLARSLDGHAMCGVIDAEAVSGGRLQLGYRRAVAAADSPFAAAGTPVTGHVFHRIELMTRPASTPAWRIDAPPEADGFTAGLAAGNLHASMLHTHWVALPGAASRFVAAARAHLRIPS